MASVSTDMSKYMGAATSLANIWGTLIYNIKDKAYGAKGDGTTDDTVAIQAAINAAGAAGGGIVWVPQGTFKFTQITITQPNITITGPGTLLDGDFIIGLAVAPAVEYRFEISDITIKRTTRTTGKHGIELQYARIGKITNVKFFNQDACIYCRPIAWTSSQHCSKIRIIANEFNTSNYCLYVDRPAVPTAAYQIGDFDFLQNHAYDIYKSHIYGLGVDGITIDGNTFFFPGYQTHNSTKEYNIYIDFGNFITMNGNKLFEAGLESVLISRCRNVSIGPNSIAWPGQRVPSSGIRFIGGDQNGDKTNVSTISGPTIQYPTLHGISIEGPCGYIAVGTHVLHLAGSTYAYYGTTDLTTLNHYAVNVEATCEFVNVAIGVAPDNNYNVLGANNYFADNIEKGRIVASKNNILTVAGTETTIASIGKYDQLNLNQSAPSTISTLTGAYEGQELNLIAFNGNTTLQHSTGTDTIKLKGGVNATIPNLGTITLQYTLGSWYEIARSF